MLLLGGIHIAVQAVTLVDSAVYYYFDHSVELPPVGLAAAAAAYIEMVDYQPIHLQTKRGQKLTNCLPHPSLGPNS